MGQEIDARGDLYSFVVVLYRALTGRVPFVGKEPADIVRAALLRGAPDPRAFADLPEDVTLALRVGLAVGAADRFATAQELVVAFEEAFAGRLSAGLRERARQLLRQQPWA
jgi:serine/threonine-protein kinase